jgi:hypothetical protein
MDVKWFEYFRNDGSSGFRPQAYLTPFGAKKLTEIVNKRGLLSGRPT